MDLYTSNLDALHHIQREVLRALTYTPSLSHADLLPEGMTGNAFNYHLKHLVSHKLIQKKDMGYELSTLGRLVIDTMSLNAKRFKLRPSVGVLLVVKSGDQTMLYASSRQPLPGFTALPFGKLRIGQTFKQTAERILETRDMDISNVSVLLPRSSFNIRYYDNGELIAHRTGEVWQAEYTGELNIRETQNGRTFWTQKNLESKELELLVSSGLEDVRIDL